MEPSTATLSIDKKIKFKKTDLQTLKNFEYYESEDFRINISNAKYCLKFYPNGDEEKERGKTWIFLHIHIGNALKVETDIDIECADASIKIDTVHEVSEGWGDPICTREELFDESKKFFIIDEIIIRVTGTLKVYLPTNIIISPFSLTWKIKESDLEALKESTTNGRLQSAKNVISPDSNVKYFLKIYPNGNKEENRRTARIYLHLGIGKNVSKIDAAFNISIDSANFSRDMEYSFETNTGWGTGICSTEYLFKPENYYFIDGEMTLKVTGIFKMEKKKWKMLQCNVWKKM